MTFERDDRAYFAERAEQHRRMAEAATDEAIAKVHRSLATLYAERICQARASSGTIGNNEADP